jgi:hypothetical protein
MIHHNNLKTRQALSLSSVFTALGFTSPGLTALVLAALVSQGIQAAESPWRLNDALNLPEGFSLSGTHRSRFENITENVRQGTSKNDQVFAFRTILNAEYRSGQFSTQLELMDSRQSGATRDSIIGNGVVNTLDILQATLNYSLNDNNNTRIKLGRFTADWGSRRLIARNRFRNTLNAFDGIEVRQQTASGNSYRYMATRPVRRLPDDRASLLDNDREADDSSRALSLYGIHATLPNLFEALTSEVYFYALREQDTPSINTRDRNLDTLGFRVFSAPALRTFDFELESIFQDGKLRSNATTRNSKLDHRAFFQYAMLGYSFDMPSRWRLQLELDYGSGDNNPFDGDNERFDSLFGVTTFEFGPGGLYGVFSRSNLISPGLRLTGNPTSRINLMLSFRHFWLAESRDSWGSTGLRSLSGDAGSYLGQHLESRIRWDIVPGNARIEGGLILLNAKNLSDNNSEFVYAGVELTF